MTDPPIRDISDTALWVPIWRAMEGERPDRITYSRNPGDPAEIDPADLGYRIAGC